MSNEEIYKELLDDLTTKIANYVKSYEEALVSLKIAALDGYAEKDKQISNLQGQISEMSGEMTHLADEVARLRAQERPSEPVVIEGEVVDPPIYHEPA